MPRDLATLYDHLFRSLDLLRESKPVELETNIKRAAAVRQTAHAVIEAAKLEVTVHKLKKSSSLDGLFPDLKELKQLSRLGHGPVPGGPVLGAGKKES